MTKRKLVFLLCFILWSISNESKAQQDPLYNLYSFNQYMINPAYAGVYNNFNGNLITRKQWAGIEGTPLTNVLSLHSSIANKFGGGLLLVNDQLGVNNNMEGQLSFSYKVIDETNKTLSFGVQGGFINYRYDYNDLNLAFVDDEGLDMNNDSFSKGNFGTGIFYMEEKFFLGFSVPRILNVRVNDGITESTRYQPHYYLSGGYIIKSNSVSEFLLKPTALLRYTGDQLSADLSMNALFLKTWWVGVTLRNLSGVAISTQFQVDRKFRFGYSFELPTNQLRQSNLGTHEVSLMIELNLFKEQFDIERYF